VKRTLLVLVLAIAASPLAGGARTDPAPAPVASAGKVYLTVDEALALAFPGAEVERTTRYLTDAQRRRVEKLGDVDLEASIAYAYVARKDGEVVGTAYFDTHRVRTLNETVMVVVTPAGKVGRLELLAFAEPEDYVPRGSWYGQFLGRELDDELNLKRGIHGVTGATLTARATTTSVRRTLALHAVLNEPGQRGRSAGAR
jgi:hypothetical protein